MIIGIEGKSGAGKSRLARVLAKEKGYEHLELDRYLKKGFKTLAELPEAEYDLDHIASDFYNMDEVRKVLQSSARPVVVDGLFMRHPEVGVACDRYIFIQTDEETEQKNLARLEEKFSGVDQEYVRIYKECVDRIWEQYEERYKPGERADVVI